MRCSGTRDPEDWPRLPCAPLPLAESFDSGQRVPDYKGVEGPVGPCTTLDRRGLRPCRGPAHRGHFLLCDDCTQAAQDHWDWTRMWPFRRLQFCRDCSRRRRQSAPSAPFGDCVGRGGRRQCHLCARCRRDQFQAVQDRLVRVAAAREDEGTMFPVMPAYPSTTLQRYIDPVGGQWNHCVCGKDFDQIVRSYPLPPTPPPPNTVPGQGRVMEDMWIECLYCSREISPIDCPRPCY